MKKLFNDFHDYLFKKLNRKLDVRDFIVIYTIIIAISFKTPFYDLAALFLIICVIFDI